LRGLERVLQVLYVRIRRGGFQQMTVEASVAGGGIPRLYLLLPLDDQQLVFRLRTIGVEPLGASARSSRRLMLVYVAIQLTNYLLEGPWVVPHSTFPSTNPFPSEDRLPIIWPGTLFNAGTMIAGLAVVLAWILSSRSTFGLELRALGLGEQAARFASVRVKRLIVTAMAVSGAFAGLAGSVEILGVRGRYRA
jgi:hypothetical protein